MTMTKMMAVMMVPWRPKMLEAVLRVQGGRRRSRDAGTIPIYSLG